MKKREMLSMLERFPEEIDLEQLVHGLYLRAKLEQSEKALKRGDTVSHAEVLKRTAEWFK